MQSGMEPIALPVQVISSLSGEPLETLSMAEIPHPGQYLYLGDTPFTVLEKRHSYHLRNGRYQLHAIRIVVRPGIPSQGLGNVSCLYHAQSPLLRCALHPLGPCENCPDYRPKHPDQPTP